uniref:hypothetical protein n=1 Tax=Trichocoleus desertorum TaxID=1481672 RepID=UPI0025B47E54|nr:hypothetical protein [Trichocoleus desertorum]
MHPLHQRQRRESRRLLLPADLPLPKYQFGQQVQWGEEEQGYGIIRGLQYFTPRMSEAMSNSLDWVGWSYLVEVDPNSPTSSGIEDVKEADLELREVQLR